MLTKEDIEQIIIDSKEEIRKSVVEQIKKDIEYSIRQQVMAEVSTVVQEAAKAELTPLLQESLIGDKSVIIAAITESCNQLAGLLAAGMVKTVSENMSQGYKRKKILEALLD